MKNIFLLLFLIVVASPAIAEGGAGSIKGAEAPIPCQTAALSGVNVSCFGLSDGSATVTINQPGVYNVIWSNGVTVNNTSSLTHTITGLSAGYYDVQVINVGNGCAAFDIINITQPVLLTATNTLVDVKCFGQSTGSVDLSVNGGTPAYSYSWSNGATTSDLTNVASGMYTVTVTDSRTCKAYDTAIIAQPAQALGQSIDSKDPDCNGSGDAWIHLTVWGGNTPYTYSWNTGPVSQNLENITAGNYSVTITDANSCTANAAVTLTNPPLLTLSSVSANNLCFGDAIGTIDLTVNGGTLPYTYTWANSDYLLAWPDEDLTGLSNYMYYVTVTDAKGCARIDSAEITSPSMLVSSITSTNVTTFGGVNGSINLSVSGGTIPYVFNWSNGNMGQNLSGIPAGWYSVLITDGNGCTRADSVYISEPLSPLGANLELKHVTCFGGSDGAIVAQASGGTPPYSYEWSNGNLTNEIGNLSAGIYSLTVTDFFGNTYTTSDTITQAEVIAFTQTITNVSCNGLPDGSIDVVVTGGTPSYTYEWYNSAYVLAALTEDLSGMPADEYYLEVTDTVGCKGGVTLTIAQPVVLNIQMDYTNVMCAGGATGTGSCTITGGSAPYTYLWSNGAQTSAISDLAAGLYTVTASDAHACFVTDSIRISQTDSIRVDFLMVPVTCIDQHDGKVTALPSGGNGDYSYTWSNAAHSESMEELTAGNYAVTVTDLMGCIGEGSVAVTKIEIECINIPTCFTPNDDGVNDVWVIKDAGLYPEFFMEIYNRWGQLLFNRDGIFEAWDGTFNGNPLPSETYYYFIRLSDQSEVMQGTITIIR